MKTILDCIVSAGFWITIGMVVGNALGLIATPFLVCMAPAALSALLIMSLACLVLLWTMISSPFIREEEAYGAQRKG